MRNVIRALRGKPVELSPKQEEKMARAQARADAMIAERRPKGRKARAEYEAFMASQGLEVQPRPARADEPARDGRGFKQRSSRPRTRSARRSTTAATILDPGPGADLNKPPPRVEDPAEREP